MHPIRPGLRDIALVRCYQPQNEVEMRWHDRLKMLQRISFNLQAKNKKNIMPVA